MNEASGDIARWLEQKRQAERVSAAVLSVLALGSGFIVFLVLSVFLYTVLSTVGGTFFPSGPWVGLIALGLSGALFARGMKIMRSERELDLDPMGSWVLRDICAFGPRLILAGLRQVRCFGQLGEMNIAACARALAYLAAQDSAVDWEELLRHCPQLSDKRLREQLSLLSGVLFLGENSSRVSLMEPFRVRLRWMLGWERNGRKAQEPARPRPQPAPGPIPVCEPENLSAYEILGLTPVASAVQIKLAYRKRIKECHPDLFAGMDQKAQALAERWTKALNAAYAALKPRH